MSNTPETPTIPDLENCLNVHGIFRCLGIVVSNLKTTHEIAGNYPQTHHKFRKHLAHIRKSRKTGSGQVQIFQVWRWPHLVMSRCNMARKLKLLKSLKSGKSWIFPREWVSSWQCQLRSSTDCEANSLDLHAKSILDNPLTRSCLAWCNFQVTSREFPKLGVLFIKFRYSQVYSEGHTKYCIVCSDNGQSTVFSSDCQDVFRRCLDGSRSRS